MSDTEAKRAFLAEQGLLHATPERVCHPLFLTEGFFDAHDLAQVRYEMLRAARADEHTVAQACRLFSFSREYFYQLERDFMARGYVALIGAPRGRRPLLELNQEIVIFLVQRKMADSNLTGEELRKEILATYQVDCSRRTVERLLEKLQMQGKRGRRSS
jgi:transposase